MTCHVDGHAAQRQRLALLVVSAGVLNREVEGLRVEQRKRKRLREEQPREKMEVALPSYIVGAVGRRLFKRQTLI